jgi:hypothetical protein
MLYSKVSEWLNRRSKLIWNGGLPTKVDALAGDHSLLLPISESENQD